MIKPSLGWKPVFMRVSTILLQYYMLKLAQILQRNLHAGLVDDCIFEVISPLTILPHSNMPICCNIYMPYCDNIVTIFVAQICRRLRGERHLFAASLLWLFSVVKFKRRVRSMSKSSSLVITTPGLWVGLDNRSSRLFAILCTELGLNPDCTLLGGEPRLKLIDMLYYNE